MRSLAVTALLCVGASVCPCVVVAQCPDGTPPPCTGRRVAARPTVAPALSVAVLDFQNLSRDTADAYLADGVAEEVSTRLGKLGRFTVVSRSAVRRLQNAATMPTADVGRVLNVAYLVTGTVRRAGTHVRIGVELLRATTGVQGWAEQYDRGEGDLLAMQDQIAGSVAEAIAGRLLPDERRALASPRAPKPEAYALYLQGIAAIHRLGTSSPREAAPLFHRAVAADSTFADAWANLAVQLALLHALPSQGGVPTDTLIIQARQAAERALALAPDGALGHVAMGWVLYRGSYDFGGAERELRVALRADPNNADGYRLLSITGKRQNRPDAMIAFERWMALDPLDPAGPGEASIMLTAQGRYADAMMYVDRAATLLPADSVRIHITRVALLLLMGKAPEARQLALQHASLDPARYADAARVIIPLYLDTSAIRRAALTMPADSDSAFAHTIIFLDVAGSIGMSDLALELRARAGARLRSIDTTTVHGFADASSSFSYRGQAPETVRFALRGVAIARDEPDRLDAGSILVQCADALMRVGEQGKAMDIIEQSRTAASVRSGAYFRLDPLYAPLRGNPRFQRLTAN